MRTLRKLTCCFPDSLCCGSGITGILMSAAALPVCLTRPPKLVLHPPPVSKSDIKPVPGFGHCCRKTTKKQARKGERSSQDQPQNTYLCIANASVRWLLCFSRHPFLSAGKTPEEVVKKYLQKVKSPPEEVRTVHPYSANSYVRMGQLKFTTTNLLLGDFARCD